MERKLEMRSRSKLVLIGHQKLSLLSLTFATTKLFCPMTRSEYHSYGSSRPHLKSLQRNRTHYVGSLESRNKRIPDIEDLPSATFVRPHVRVDVIQ